MGEISAVVGALPHWEGLVFHWGESLTWALVLLVAGWSASTWVERAVLATGRRLQSVDPMVSGFLANLSRWLVALITGLVVLDRLGVQTSSLVAVVGAAGLAVGLALQSTLTNLAAGLMLLAFRPFRVGQSIESGALSGVVTRVALFHTELTTGDNVQVVAPNSVLWAGALRNESHFPLRNVGLTVPLPIALDPSAAMVRIRALIAGDTRIATDPAPFVGVLKFNGVDKTTEIEVHFWTETAVLREVKADLLEAIWRECLKG